MAKKGQTLLYKALIRHRSSFGDTYFAWAKRKIVAEIEAEKRAEREREEKEVAEQRVKGQSSLIQ